MDELLGADPAPGEQDLDEAFWPACQCWPAGMAEYLLDRGASIDAKPDYTDSPPIESARSRTPCARR